MNSCLNLAIFPNCLFKKFGKFFFIRMTHEIVSIHVGHCGNRIGSSFWDMINKEHSINQSFLYNKYDFDYQLKNIEVYYNETMFCNFVPRAIFIDSDEESMNSLKKKAFFDSSNIIYADPKIYNNWAAGFYPEDRNLIETIKEIIRKETELCDMLSGFHLFHSLGGGIGSGLGCLILKELRDEYPEQVLSTFSIFPSKKIDDSNYSRQLYNSILSLNQLNQTADEIFYFDNEELYEICFHKLKIYTPAFYDLNYSALCCMSSITSSLRYPDQLNSDLRKIYNNIIPFPRLKFIKSTYFPYHSRGECCSLLEIGVLSSFFSEKKENDRLCSYINLNGRFRTDEVNKLIDIAKSKEITDLKVSLYKTRIGSSRSATLIENSTKIKSLLERQKKDFLYLYKKRLYAQYYINEGLDDEEFENANLAVTDLIQDYEDLCHSNEEEEYYM